MMELLKSISRHMVLAVFRSMKIKFVEKIASSHVKACCGVRLLCREASGTPQSPAHSAWLPCLVSPGSPFLLRDTQLT